MRLIDLIQDQDHLENTSGIEDVDVTGLTQDSRAVEPGFIFAAFSGSKSDGKSFIPDAIEKGAVAILTDKQVEGVVNIPVIISDNPRQQFAKMIADFYQSQPEVIVAVTGTNGKTSTAHFTRQIWQKMNYAAASLGTIGITAPGVKKYGSLTTPDPVTLHEELAELEKSGVTHLALEGSSHGLDQYRLDGVRIKAAGFTSFSRDHMDYHETEADYLAAKTRLFSEVMQPYGVAVLNADIPEFKALNKVCQERGIRVLSYGYKACDIKLTKREPLLHGQSVSLMVFGQNYNFEFPLAGAFQIMNALCALGLVLSEFLENPLKQAESVTALEKLTGVKGRLELVAYHPNGAAIYVDYAHTPDALENVLKALRPHTSNQLHALIGCGGDRDKGKRPQMGKVAQDLADHVIITDDNPRTENPDIIRQEIMTACPKAQEVGDRAKAIKEAIAQLNSGDILVVAGKGHEQGQIIGTEVKPFDDAEEIKKELAGV